MKYIQHNHPTPGTFTILEGPDPKPAAHEVVIYVAATALNRADLLQVAGKYPPPAGESEILGLDVAGTVVEVGSEVEGFAVGDNVCALVGGGGYAQYLAIDAAMLLRLPERLSFTKAAAIPEVFLTAFQALHWIAGIEAGDRVLIHAGASGVGTAAIQLCNLVGATPIVTASANKHERLLGLGAANCIDYRSGDFAAAVNELTNGKGVNIVLDFVGAPYLKQNMQALTPDGHLVCLGFLGGSYLEGTSLAPLVLKRLQVTGTTLRSRKTEYRQALVADFRAEIWPHFATGKLNAVVDMIYDWELVADAHAYMAA
ncbi:MAG: NAD(P)H-quinone oxidoreductase, partial [Bacteroidota bacterium]